jgi:hypothetical protein
MSGDDAGHSNVYIKMYVSTKNFLDFYDCMMIVSNG